ncbi:transcriptional regulator [Amycolatopsis acidiphila]|nr:transcriptional regulator [Amycolatopsis acidiphila]
MAALDLLGRRWSMRILWELSQAPAGFRDLQRRCENMSSSVLSVRLNELTGTQLVSIDDEGYQLTEPGRQLVDAIAPLEAWSVRWAGALGKNSRRPRDSSVS